MLSLSDLAAMRGAVSASLPETCTIVRGTATMAAVSCLLTEDTMTSRPVRARGGGDLHAVRRWRVKVGDGIDVRPDDVLQVAGKGTYVVVQLDNPSSNSTSTVVYAYQVLDSLGRPSYITPTAGVTVLRVPAPDASGKIAGPISVASNVPVRIEETDMVQEGSRRYRAFIIYTCGYPLPDIRERDTLVDPSDIAPDGQAATYIVTGAPRRRYPAHLDISARRPDGA